MQGRGTKGLSGLPRATGLTGKAKALFSHERPTRPVVRAQRPCSVLHGGERLYPVPLRRSLHLPISTTGLATNTFELHEAQVQTRLGGDAPLPTGRSQIASSMLSPPEMSHMPGFSSRCSTCTTPSSAISA